MPDLYDRVILRQAPCPHLFHRLTEVRRQRGCIYETCPDCLTRRLTIEPGGEPETAWLLTGHFTTDQPSILELPMEGSTPHQEEPDHA